MQALITVPKVLKVEVPFLLIVPMGFFCKDPMCNFFGHSIPVCENLITPSLGSLQTLDQAVLFQGAQKVRGIAIHPTIKILPTGILNI